MPKIDPVTIEDIRQRSDIVDIIGNYIPLKKAGANFKGLCPFHNEKTPSFNVSAEKQIFKCFGCGEGGDVFSFLMKYHNQSYPEVLKELAWQHGIVLEMDEAAEEQQSHRQLLKKINEAACSYFQWQLQHPEIGQEARVYLHQRGINHAMIETFRLGYARESWHALEHHLLDKGFALEDLKASGLFGESEKSGGIYDLFRHRLMFPIANVTDEIIAFGGRSLSNEKQAKYINSPETALYHKGEQVYALNLAKRKIREQDLVILAEGYLDVITAHQFGFEQTVAALGTALTEQQARSILRYTENKQVLMAYDADSAGQKATERGVEVMRTIANMNEARIRVLTIPEGQDPDTFLHEFGPDSFQALMDVAQPIVEYQIERVLNTYDLSDAVGKADAARVCIDVLLKINEPIYRDECIQFAAEKLKVDRDVLKDQLLMTQRKRKRYQKNRYGSQKQTHQKSMPLDTDLNSLTQVNQKVVGSEMGLIFMMLEYPEHQGAIAEIFQEMMFTQAYNELLRQTLLKTYQQGLELSWHQLFDAFPEQLALHKHLTDIMENPLFQQLKGENEAAESEKSLADFVRNVKLHCREMEREKLSKNIALAEAAGDQATVERLMHDYMILMRDLNQLKQTDHTEVSSRRS